MVHIRHVRVAPVTPLDEMVHVPIMDVEDRIHIDASEDVTIHTINIVIVENETRERDDREVNAETAVIEIKDIMTATGIGTGQRMGQGEGVDKDESADNRRTETIDLQHETEDLLGIARVAWSRDRLSRPQVKHHELQLLRTTLVNSRLNRRRCVIVTKRIRARMERCVLTNAKGHVTMCFTSTLTRLDNKLLHLGKQFARQKVVANGKVESDKFKGGEIPTPPP